MNSGKVVMLLLALVAVMLVSPGCGEGQRTGQVENAGKAAQGTEANAGAIAPCTLISRAQVEEIFGEPFHDGEDKSLLLRKDGALLLALQHILNKVSPHKVQVDCEFFRRRKEKQLREYAQQVAEQVSQTRRDEVLDPMNPYERRIVHIAVNQVPGITSESLGDGFLKRVKIFPVQRPAD